MPGISFYQIVFSVINKLYGSASMCVCASKKNAKLFNKMRYLNKMIRFFLILLPNYVY